MKHSKARQRLKKELTKLDLKEQRLLDLAADAELNTKQLRKRLRNLQTRRTTITEQLNQSDEHLKQETNLILSYLILLENPKHLYETAAEPVKRKLLLAFFAHIWIDDDGHTTKATTTQQHTPAELQRLGQNQSGDGENHPDDQALATKPGLHPTPATNPELQPNQRNQKPKSSPKHNKSAGLQPDASRISHVTCSNETNLVALAQYTPNTPVELRPPAARITDRPVITKRRATKRVRQRVVELYQSGRSARYVAGEVGVSRTTVLNILIQSGVERRPVGPVPRAI